MSLSNASEFNSVGGYGGFGGFGGGGILEGIILASLLGRNRGGILGGGGDDGCCGEAALLAAIANGKDATVAEGRNIRDAVCESEKTNLQQFYAAAIQSANNTQAVKDQATGFAIVADKRFDDLAAAGVAQTAAILAKLNQTEIDNLRDQLFGERRRCDGKDIEINMTSIQNQQQQQFQAQNEFLGRKFAEFDNQINNTKQGIINLGTMVASGTQSTAATNIGK